jgi:hypothetical protein
LAIPRSLGLAQSGFSFRTHAIHRERGGLAALPQAAARWSLANFLRVALARVQPANLPTPIEATLLREVGIITLGDAIWMQAEEHLPGVQGCASAVLAPSL